MFGAVARLRGALYDRSWLACERVDAAVISVGNLSVGGTGKTPMVAWLAREFERRGRRVGIASRGYGVDSGPNDEARQLARELPGTPHVQNPDRARAARELIERGVDVVLLDDGFQHRRLGRDLDLVLIDATRPWGLPPDAGSGEPVCAFLPRGLLREHPAALARADLVVLTRADQASSADLVALRARIGELAPGVPVAVASHVPRRLASPFDGRDDLEPAALEGRTVELVSAIGNPESFERSVRELGAEVRAHRRFPDHHAYSKEDLAGLGRGGALVVTTAKDAVKWTPALLPAGLEVRVLEVELDLVEGAAVLAALLDACPESSREAQRRAAHAGLAG